ncbi:isochorismate synthase [Nonomuraea sp. SYSU D8015]|uniref:isochorismate synthase n=1 Tax=Nonomuraea sp. SYSU D8015 TaxID=2593644 RepID=UPI00166053FA|nr:isochorismate synthase [Nonomuraea sp. SYSU D8015]
MTLSLLPPKAPLASEHIAPLIGQYRSGDILLSGGSYSFLGRGGRTLTGISLDDLPATLATCLGSDPQAIAAGAITFDATSCRLTLCDEALWAGPLSARSCFRCGTSDWQITAIPAEPDYVKAVQIARDRITAGELDKVVLARTLELIGQQPVSVTDLLLHLGGRGAHTYAVPLGGQETLIGASPELLVARHGRTVTANPLAGSARRNPANPRKDRAIADRLLMSAKDRHEHRLVADAVAAALAPHCEHVHVPEPTLLATPTMWHLSTPIIGRLASPAPTSLELAAVLHPTPAVCGTPTAAAAALITELEGGMGVARDYYAGLVGWQDASGDGEWAIALRGAVLDGEHRLRLFAGAGIVADSNPDLELAETDAKFLTMLRALHARTVR